MVQENIDYEAISKNPEVVRLIKQRMEIERKIMSLDKEAIIKLELQLLSL